MLDIPSGAIFSLPSKHALRSSSRATALIAAAPPPSCVLSARTSFSPLSLDSSAGEKVYVSDHCMRWCVNHAFRQWSFGSGGLVLVWIRNRVPMMVFFLRVLILDTSSSTSFPLLQLALQPASTHRADVVLTHGQTLLYIYKVESMVIQLHLFPWSPRYEKLVYSYPHFHVLTLQITLNLFLFLFWQDSGGEPVSNTANSPLFSP